MKEDVKLWWKQSEADIKTAKHSGEAGDYYAAGFWAQQAVEKGLKALILNKNAEFKKIHDLECQNFPSIYNRWLKASFIKSGKF